ncbi:MAG: ROK family protein [Catenulispora sp.]|nr:ROK family protein [Catenulispora sp.]
MINARELLRATSVKDLNRARVIRAVMVQPAPQNRIAQLTMLSEATVSTTVRSLVTEGALATEPGPDRSKWVRLGDDVRGVAVGVDLGYTRVTVAVRNVGETRIHVATEAAGLDVGQPDWLDVTVDLIGTLVAEVDATPADVVSIGMAEPGGVDPRDGVVTMQSMPPLVPAEGDPVTVLSRRLGLRVVADNNANLGAYAEFLYGSSRDASILVYVWADSNINAGIIIDGAIMRGANGFAGELGHLTVDRNGPVCRCGSRGCLEAYIAERRLVDEVRAVYSTGTRSMPTMPTTLDGVIERAVMGEPVDCMVLRDAGSHLGFALAQLSNILNPDKIVIGGGLSEARDPRLLLDPLSDAFKQYALRPVSQVPVMFTELGHEGPVRGAIALGLNSHQTA